MGTFGRAGRIFDWMLSRYGGRYPRVLLVVLLRAQHLVLIVSLGVLALYLPMSWADFAVLALASVVAQEVYAALTLRYLDERFKAIEAWFDGERGPEQATAAWQAAASVPVQLLRLWWRGGYPLLSILAWSGFATWQLELPAWAMSLVFAAASVGVLYGNAMIFLVVERALRPVLDQVATSLDEATDAAADSPSLPLSRRLLASLPALNVITGVGVVGLVGTGDGDLHRLADAVFFSLLVALVGMFGLTALLSSSIVAPIHRLRDATERVAGGDLGARVPVVTADETGELTRAFNDMVGGLQERERLRDAFGSFVDPELAERVARDGTDLRGEEVELSILFMDVVGFTTFAEQAPATAVVARLNDLYELVVPVILRHGGHANKFIGDGLLAVFGAPERHPDHADRAVASALEIDQCVRQHGEGLQVGLGVNSGSAVVGTIGGGGRLDFTVIGDAVNTAARVESTTRITGDEVLITAETHAKLTREHGRWVERPAIPLKGKAEEIAVFAPVRASD